jgi:hypothetical protein
MDFIHGGKAVERSEISVASINAKEFVTVYRAG